MTSAVGDIVNNPAIQDQDSDQVSLLSRFLNSFNKGAVWLPDAITNTLPKSVATVGDLLLNPAMSGDNKDPLKRALINAHVPQNIVENTLRDLGIIQDLPEAKTFSGKEAESIGGTLGSLALPVGVGALGSGAGAVGQALGKALLGTDAPLTSLSQLANPTFAGTVGANALPAIVSPALHDQLKDHPFTESATNLGLALLGGAGGSYAAAKALPSASEQLPFATAAQTGDLNSAENRALRAKQLDLVKRNPDAADLLQKISENQESSILSKMNPETTMSGQDILGTIEDSINHLKSQRSSDYQNSLKNIIQNFNARNAENMLEDYDGKPPLDAQQFMSGANNYEGIDVNGTLDKIDSLMKQSATGSPIQNALIKAKSMVIDNADDPMKLISAKSAIQDMTQPTNGMNLGTKQSAMLQQISSQLNQDLEKSMPGYADMNSNYAQQTQQLNDLLEGIVGKVARSGENHPTQVVRQLFEKTDPALVGQLKEVLPPDVYSQAANLYLQDVAERGLQSPTKNSLNMINKYQKMGDILQKNRNVLSQTLPSDQNSTIDQVLQDIQQTSYGRPRNDYASDAFRNVAVGNEIKGLGQQAWNLTKGMAGPAIGYGVGTSLGMGPAGAIAGALPAIYDRGMNYLNTQEMLTGLSPMQQVTNAISSQVAPTLQKGITANTLPNVMSNAKPQAPIAQQPAPQAAPTPSAAAFVPPPAGGFGNGPISAVLSKYGVQTGPQMPPAGAPSAQPQTPGATTSAPQNLSPIDSVMTKYGIGQGAQNPYANPQYMQPQLNQSKGRVYSPDELDNINKMLNNENQNIPSNPNNNNQGASQSNLENTIRKRESNNDYNTVNKLGYLGAYQMGAQALEDTGLLKKGASAQGNTALNDPDNWNIPGGKDAFLQNQQLQDQAMQNLLDLNKSRLIQSGYITPNTPDSQVNGYLAVMHLGGMGGLGKLMQGTPVSDVNGTSTADYYNMGVGA